MPSQGPPEPVRNTQAVPRFGALTFVRFLTSKLAVLTGTPKTQCKKSLTLSNSIHNKMRFLLPTIPHKRAHYPPFRQRSFYVRSKHLPYQQILPHLPISNKAIIPKIGGNLTHHGAARTHSSVNITYCIGSTGTMSTKKVL